MKKLFWLVFAAVEAAGAFFFIKGAHHTSGSTSFAAAGLGTICGGVRFVVRHKGSAPKEEVLTTRRFGGCLALVAKILSVLPMCVGTDESKRTKTVLS